MHDSCSRLLHPPPSTVHNSVGTGSNVIQAFVPLIASEGFVKSAVRDHRDAESMKVRGGG